MDALTGVIAQIAPNLMLLVIIAIPLVLTGLVVVLFLLSRFDAWAIVEYGFESKNDLRNFKVKFSQNKNFLLSAGIPGLDPKAGFPIPVIGKPIRVRGKPAYRYYSPEPGIFVPVTLALDREVYVGNKKDEAGADLLEDGKPIPVYARIGDLIPKIGFEPKQAYAESYNEAEKLFAARNKMMALLATWGPIIIFVVLMLVVIVMLGQLVAGLAGGVTVQCTTEAITKAGGAVEVTAPFFK
jgi:hypothetical protein